MIRPSLTVVLGVLLAASVWAELAPLVRCTGFEKEDAKVINIGKNSSGEIVEAKEDEIIPEGKGYLRLTLVASNETFMSIKLPTDRIPATTTKITMWIKGSPENKDGPTLVLGNWHWKGLGWNGASRIDVSEGEWVKYEFKTEDFIWHSYKGEKMSGPMKIKDNSHVFIFFNPGSGYSGSVTFCIDDIEIE